MQPATRSTPLPLAITLIACTCATPASAGDTCTLIENGSFTKGVGDWVPNHDFTIKGDGFADIESGIFDSNGLGGMDENVFAFIIDALATGVQDAGFGETTVNVSLSRTLTLDGPTLQFIYHGESDIFWWGVATIDFAIEIDVEDSKGIVHTVPVAEATVPTTPTSCGIGLGLGGFYNHPFNANVTTVDLAAATGIAVGETVTLTFRFILHLDAPGVCDQAHYETYFVIDEVTFCCQDRPADLNDDGTVNVFDLLALLGAWGPCASPCPADIAPEGGNGQVNVFDLLALLSAWGPCQ